MLENTAIVSVVASWQHDGVSETFGARVKRLMLAKGWKNAELARRSGLSATQISRFTNDKRGDRPEWEKTVKPLASALGVTPNYLLAGALLRRHAPPAKSALETAFAGRSYSAHVRAYAFQMAELLEGLGPEEIRELLDAEEMNVRRPVNPDPYPERARARKEILLQGPPTEAAQKAMAYIVKHPQYDQIAEFAAKDAGFWIEQYHRALAVDRGEQLNSKRREQSAKKDDAKMFQPKPKKRRKKLAIVPPKKHSA